MLLKNSFFNLLGTVLPVLVAIPSLGYMARALDADLFGVTMLIFSLVGYAGVFDAGLGKAVVLQIALDRSEKDYALTLGSALSFVALTSSFAAILLISISGYLVGGVFNVEEGSESVINSAVVISAFCIPALLLTIIFQSYLEGVEKFKIFNIFRTISGTLLYLIPTIMLMITNDFLMMVVGLVLARILSLLIITGIVSQHVPIYLMKFNSAVLVKMLRFGSWLAVTNIISPMMVYMDKFIVVYVVGTTKFAYYSGVAELVNKLSLFPVSITRALFPRLAATEGDVNKHSLKMLSYIYMLVLCISVATILFVFAEKIIGLWLGSKFVLESSPVLKVLLIGFVLNSLALVAYNSLQSRGKSYLTAKIHLVEVVPYLLTVYILAQEYGLVGAASAWSVRMFIDMLIMIYFDRKYSRQSALV